MIASSFRGLVDLMFFGTLRCFSETTLRASTARYIKLGFRVALFFVIKIATNYRLSITFSKSTPTKTRKLLPQFSPNKFKTPNATGSKHADMFLDDIAILNISV